MKLYLTNLLDRLKHYSQSLDRKEIFIEHPWVLIDENNDYQKYIFKRDGELIMSLNGKVTIGKWEYISSAKSILIDRVQDKILLNQNFIDPALMVLKMDGLSSENFILANEAIIPELNIEKYLRQLFYRTNNIILHEAKNGQTLEISRFPGQTSIGSPVYVNAQPAVNQVAQLKNYNQILIIEHGRLQRILKRSHYKYRSGMIAIEHDQHRLPRIGDQVFKDESLAPDGKYQIGFLKKIIVIGGVIRGMKIF